MRPGQKLKEVRGIFGSRFLAPMPDPHIGGVIERDGVREFQMSAMLLAACHARKLFVDVGANIGWHTVLVGLKNPRARIIALEPHPETFSILLENLRINGGMENAQALCVGASDCVDQVTMYEHPESLGGSQAWPRENWDKSAAVTIDLARLDSILEVEKVVPVMKMETQGFEVRALRGCAGIRIEKLFITYAPRMIEGAGDDPREFRSLLASRFHSLRRIDPKSGPCEVRWDDLDATARKGEVSTFFDIVCEGAR